MDYLVRRLTPSELEEALELAWTTYQEFEAPDYEPEGVQTFHRDIVQNGMFKEGCRSGENKMWGAFDGEKLVGIFVMRGVAHICLAFTHRDYHRKGIATAIFKILLKDVRQENPELVRLTLNSSPYALPFYRHVGFAATDNERKVDGIRFTSMEYML